MPRLTTRSIPVLAIALVAFCVTGPVFAADYLDDLGDFRGPLPGDWGADSETDPIGIEAGLRYWYALGAQSYSVGSSDFTGDDVSHILEGHFRVDDFTTNSYVKALVGSTVATNGTFSTFNDPTLTTGSIVDGKIAYAGADFGMGVFGDSSSTSVGWLAGYHYWNDSPDTSRANYTTATSASDVTWSPVDGSWSVGGDSQENNIDIHALRLGISGKTNLGFLDISGEVAAVPFAWVNGTLGAAGVGSTTTGSNTTIQSSATSVNGYGYGAMAELMLGVHPTDNMTIRVGARAWYLQGTVDATYSTITVSDPVDSNSDGTFDTGPVVTSQDYISTSNPFSQFRAGALVELTYSF